MEWDTGTADLAKLGRGRGEEDLFPSNWEAVVFEEIWMQFEVDDNATWFWL